MRTPPATRIVGKVVNGIICRICGKTFPDSWEAGKALATPRVVKGRPASHMRRAFVKGRSITRAGAFSCGRRELCGMAAPPCAEIPAMNRIGGPVNGVSRQAAHHAQQHGAARGGHGMTAGGTDEALPGGVRIAPRRFPVSRLKAVAWFHGVLCTVEHAQRANSPGVQRHDTVKRAIPASGAGLIFEGGVAIIGHR